MNSKAYINHVCNCMYLYVCILELFNMKPGTEKESLWLTLIKSLCMIHILKLTTDLFSRSTLEVLKKINTMPIVRNAERLLGGVHKICSAGVSAALLQMLSAALKKNCCCDSTSELMHQFCVCARSPFAF